MADNPYSGRKIGAIAVSEMGLYPTEPNPAGGAQISIELVTGDGAPGGPHARIAVGLTIDGQMTLEQFRLGLFERALFVLKRIANETPESLRDIWIQSMTPSDQASSDTTDSGYEVI